VCCLAPSAHVSRKVDFGDFLAPSLSSPSAKEFAFGDEMRLLAPLVRENHLHLRRRRTRFGAPPSAKAVHEIRCTAFGEGGAREMRKQARDAKATREIRNRLKTILELRLREKRRVSSLAPNISCERTACTCLRFFSSRDSAQEGASPDLSSRDRLCTFGARRAKAKKRFGAREPLALAPKAHEIRCTAFGEGEGLHRISRDRLRR